MKGGVARFGGESAWFDFLSQTGCRHRKAMRLGCQQYDVVFGVYFNLARGRRAEAALPILESTQGSLVCCMYQCVNSPVLSAEIAW